MNRAPKKYRILLVILITSWILFFPAYVYSYNLTEADFICSSPHWEDPILEGLLLANFEKKWAALDFSVHSAIFFHENSQSELLPHLPFQNLLRFEKGSILRC